jgi:hypothetical protein
MSANVMTASKSLLDELHEQRWDDHRFYHQSRINQSLHFFSACSFLLTYAMLPFFPAEAAVFGWIVPMVSRQIGHFFFEPKGYDAVNQATHEHKEKIKVGYNLRRKVILHTVWAAIPLTLIASPTFFGVLDPRPGLAGYVHNLGLMWLALAGAGLLGRILWLAMTRSVRTGLVWGAKILTDPFHDAMIYHSAPLHLLRGELMDPMTHVAGH